jgi:hypothetical protein
VPVAIGCHATFDVVVGSVAGGFSTKTQTLLGEIDETSCLSHTLWIVDPKPLLKPISKHSLASNRCEKNVCFFVRRPEQG